MAGGARVGVHLLRSVRRAGSAPGPPGERYREFIDETKDLRSVPS